MPTPFRVRFAPLPVTGRSYSRPPPTAITTSASTSVRYSRRATNFATFPSQTWSFSKRAFSRRRRRRSSARARPGRPQQMGTGRDGVSDAPLSSARSASRSSGERGTRLHRHGPRRVAGGSPPPVRCRQSGSAESIVPKRLQGRADHIRSGPAVVPGRVRRVSTAAAPGRRAADAVRDGRRRWRRADQVSGSRTPTASYRQNASA